MIVAEQVQQAVQREHPRLDAEGVPRAAGLTARDAGRDRDVSQEARLPRGEREDVGGRILYAGAPG